MTAVESPNLIWALPELFLTCASIALLILGIFQGNQATRLVSWLAVLTLAVTGFLVLELLSSDRVVIFSGMFIVDRFSGFIKLLILLASILTLVISQEFITREQIQRFEYPVLFLFATLGMMMMVSANDLMALYIGLELQSLSLYIVVTFQRDRIRSSEAGLKYFILGSLSSGILLYGASLIYGFSGTTSFDHLATLFQVTGLVPLGTVGGVVFVCAGIAFKASAVPFHMWTPDVYEGAPTPVTAFLAAAPKVASLALLLRVLTGPLGYLGDQWQQIILIMSSLSMILGGLAAINQTNIKRLMAYSSIGHVGYALIGLAVAGAPVSGNPELSLHGIHSVLVYLAIYMVMNIGTFAVILCMKVNGRMVEGIGDLAGLSKTNPLLAAVMATFMFSMAGIPPLAGFFSKLYIFLSAMEAHLYALAVIGILSSVVAAYYYMRIVKIMYFDEPIEEFDPPVESGIKVVLIGTGLFTLLFFLFPGTIVGVAARAAATLL
jgi:NADH-quinone oxidoreductase subunit N